jgi:hypothetical protein
MYMKAWLISTGMTGFVVGVSDLVISGPSSPVLRMGLMFLLAIIINSIIWMPIFRRIHRNRKMSLVTAISSSVVAGYIGISIILAILWLVIYQEAVQVSGALFTINGDNISTISVNFKGPTWGMLLPGVFWGVNGFIFWWVFTRFVTNQNR